MPEISTDRRAVRTRKALANAPAELLTQKELHRITVQEICDKADLILIPKRTADKSRH